MAYRWISDPTPVTSRIHVTESGSARKPMCTSRLPAWNQVKRLWTLVRASLGRLSSAMSMTTDQTKASAMSVVASQPAFGSPMRLPASSRTTEPASGSSGTSHTRSRRSRAISSALAPLALQQIHVVGGRAAAAPPEDGHDDRQAHGHLGRGHHEHEEHDRLTADVVQRLGERDERDVDRVEHELDAHEHHEDVAPHEQADGADGEQDRRER